MIEKFLLALAAIFSIFTLGLVSGKRGYQAKANKKSLENVKKANEIKKNLSTTPLDDKRKRLLKRTKQ